MLNPCFRRCFVSFPSQKQSFLLGCRPFICLDGCFLKGPYGDVLLVVSLDANGGIFPISLGWEEAEKFETWYWFMALLDQFIGDKELRRI